MNRITNCLASLDAKHTDPILFHVYWDNSNIHNDGLSNMNLHLQKNCAFLPM